ncbi:hypothetical protein CMK12_15805 [Candidatus Poribacteria bacterium]|nr:hypothetical protein [Candidatus Poribacteria bacterium]
MKPSIHVEDHAVSQLFMSAIEAYEIEHKATKRSKGYDKLETFGLLWGYSIPQKGNQPPKIIVTHSTVETSAVRHSDWVAPDFESIEFKREFMQRYWPSIELVGSFHSHPYEDLEAVKHNKGWRASPEDEEFFPYFHEMLAKDQEYLAHIIVTVTKLQKRGWAIPERFYGGQDHDAGYVVSADNRKLWIRGYCSQFTDGYEEAEDAYFEGDEEASMEEWESYDFISDVNLEIPSIERRFL